MAFRGKVRELFFVFCVIIYTVLGSKDAEVLDMLGKNGEFLRLFGGHLNGGWVHAKSPAQ